jgi:hypothetical protein
MNKVTNQASSENRRGTFIGSVLAICLMICFAAIVILFGRWLFTQWDTRGILILCGLASIEAIVSFWVVLKLPTAQRQIAFYRFTEWAVIFILIKFFTEFRAGSQHLFSNIQQWPINFPTNLLNGEFLLNFILVFIVWMFSQLFASDLHLLEIDEAVRFDEQVKTISIRDRVLRRILYLGMGIVVLAGVMLQDVAAGSHPGTSSGIIPFIILFFVLGLALLSLTRFASLQSAWRQAGVSIPVQIPRRWLVYGFLILIACAVIAVFLPTHYGMGFFETIIAVIRLLTIGVTYLFALIVFLIETIARLFSSKNNSALSQPVASTPPPNPLPTTSPAARQDLLGSTIFWVFLIAVFFIALRQYILYNRDLAAELKRFKPILWIMSGWKQLMAAIKNTNRKVGSYLQDRLQQLRHLVTPSPDLSDWNYINLRRLSPRQRIIFYYLALIKRAGETHTPRHEDQTPYEYAQTLTTDFQEGRDGVDAITETFIEARYSRHEIPREKENKTRSAWESLRRILRKRRNPVDETKPPEN